MYEPTVVRKQEEIDELLNQCAELKNNGDTKFPGMTYESGITTVLTWLFSKNEPHPLDD